MPLVPPIAQIRWYNAPFLALLIFFAVYYRWTVQPDLRATKPESGLYNQLTDSFLTGQVSLRTQPDPRLLQLADPYDPEKNAPYRWHDMSLYKGKYYAYFGPAAALTLFLPFRLAFGIALPDRVGLAMFATGAFLASCMLLKIAITHFYPQTPAALFYALCCVLGFSNTFPVLLRRPDMYEIAIASGQFFLFWGLYLITRSAIGVESSNKSAWFGGAMLGMAVHVEAFTDLRQSGAVMALVFSTGWEKPAARTNARVGGSGFTGGDAGRNLGVQPHSI